jgi:phosphotransferase system enzyme I (PtsP)
VGEGVGLYRTEIPFMLKDRFPSEREQYQLYRALLNRYRGQSVTMRTLDVGGDKPLPYFPIAEDNPFLGWRGVRLTLDHPEIFLVQIRAMLRASIGLNNLQIMLPMITSVGEVEDCLRLIQQAIQEIEEETRHASQSLVKPKIGVMVEVPGIVFQIPQLATKIDFLSVGSNDLTQYLLAVDRNNPRVAGLYNSYHPAVLSALHTIVAQANRQHLPVTLCGEFAGDPGGMLLLIGMGYRRLSMNSHSVLKAKWVIRSVKQADCKQLLQEVVACEHSQQVKEQVNAFLQSKGLGGLVRAGLY